MLDEAAARDEVYLLPVVGNNSGPFRGFQRDSQWEFISQTRCDTDTQQQMSKQMFFVLLFCFING